MKTTKSTRGESFNIRLFFGRAAPLCRTQAFSSCTKRSCFHARWRGLLAAGASLVGDVDSGCVGSVSVARGLSWTPTYGIFPDKESKRWTLDHQGSLKKRILKSNIPANPEQTTCVHLYVYSFIYISAVYIYMHIYV